MPIVDLKCATPSCPREGRIEEHLVGLNDDAVLCPNCFDPMTQLSSLCTNFSLKGTNWPSKELKRG